MSMMPTLPDSFKTKYGITDIHNHIEGGQKDVYIVTLNGEKMAVKRYRLAFDPRATRELDILKRFSSNQGIPHTRNVVQEGNSTFVFEEFIEGVSLEDCKDGYASNVPKTAKLIIDVCDILEPIWAERIVHRDLKPQNIIIRPDGTPVVIDFGIARDPDGSTITLTGEQPLTFQYAAPEQIAADRDQISYRTDFFSLGVIAHRLLLRNFPFGTSRQEIEGRIAAKDENLVATHGSPLEEFFRDTLHFSQSERPRDVKRMLHLLAI